MAKEILVGGVLGYAGGRASRCAVFLSEETGAPTSTESPELRPSSGITLSDVTFVLPIAGGAIVAGNFELPQPRLARIDSDGANDATFVPAIDGPVDQVLPHDGGYLLLGSFTTVGGESRNGFARINADGSVDLDWDHAFAERATAMALHGSGVLVGYGISAATGNLTRLDASGAEDSGFTTHTFNGRVRTIHVQSGGALIVGGDFTEYDGTTSVLHIVRFASDGAVDATWVGPTGDTVWSSYNCYDIKPDSTGNLYCDLRSSIYSRVKKLTANGATIAWSGDAQDLAAPITVTPDDGIAAWSQGGSTTRHVLRFNSDGSVVPGFTTSGPSATNPTGTGNVLVLGDGRTLAAGSFTAIGGLARGGVACLLPDGTVDPDFDAGLSGDCNAIAPVPGGGIVAVGRFGTAGATVTSTLARIKYGAVDPSYKPQLGITVVATPALQRLRQDVSLGRTYITGFFNIVSLGGVGRMQGGVARLMPDGSPDAEFEDPGIRFSSDPADVWDVCIDESDHSLVVCGLFTSVKAGAYARSNLAKFNPDGSVVPSWNPPTFNSRVNRVIRQPDGKFVVGGIFTTVGGTAMAGVARLNADGTRDTGFSNPTINVSGTTRQVFDLALQPDGKILVSGSFTSVGGSSSPGIARLNADGTRDAGFVTSVTGPTACVALADDGSIFVGGNSAVAKMDSTGAPAVWSNPFSTGDSIADIKLNPDGTVLVTGTFERDGQSSLARLLPSGAFDPTFSVPLTQGVTGPAAALTLSEHEAPALELVRTASTFLPFEGRPGEFAYAVYGGDKPYTFAIRGRAPDGLSMADGTLSGVFSAAGRFRWAVDVTDAAGDVGTIVDDTRVAPLAVSYGALVTRSFGGASSELARFGWDGTLIEALHAFDNPAYLKRVRDGSIVSRGTFATIDSGTRRYLAKHGPDGVLDTGFPGLAAGTIAWVTGLKSGGAEFTMHTDVDVQSDGRIILACTLANTPSAGNRVGQIRRINLDGTNDPGFVLDSDVAISYACRVVVEDDDSILVGGRSNSSDPILFRVDPDGALDDAFLAAFPGAYTSAQRFTSTGRMWTTVLGDVVGEGRLTHDTTTGGVTHPSCVFDFGVTPSGDIVVVGGMGRRGHTGGGLVRGVDWVYSTGGFVGNPRNALVNGDQTILDTTAFDSPVVSRVYPLAGDYYALAGTFTHQGASADRFTSGYVAVERTPTATAWRAFNYDDTDGTAHGISFADRLPDGRLYAVTVDSAAFPTRTAVRLFPDGAVDASFAPINNAFTILVDNNGVSGFSADGFVEMSLDAEGGEPIVPFSSDGSIYFIAGASPPPLIEMHEEFAVTDADPYAVLLYTLTERLRVQDQASPLLHFVSLLTDSVVVRDFTTIVFDRTFASEITLSDDTALDWVVTVADALMVADERLSLLDALITVVSALVVRDNVIPVLQRDVDEVLALAETESAQILAIVEAASALVMGDGLADTMLLFGDLSADVDFSGSDPTALLALLTEIMDAADLGVRIRVGDDLFMGYAVNTRNAAVSQYQNFPFNSFALVGGKAYGAGPAGIYRLGGDTDDGDPIQALLRTGVVNFEELVHVPNAWIGLTSDGQMILKTVTTDKGRKKENWYRMKERPHGAPVESRFDPAKGLASTYWQWELENVDGAYFELDMLKVWPVRIGRRYSGR